MELWSAIQISTRFLQYGIDCVVDSGTFASGNRQIIGNLKRTFKMGHQTPFREEIRTL